MAGDAKSSEREAPRTDVLWWAKRTMGYGGQSLDRGQVLKLRQLANDKLLVDLGYVAMIPSGVATFPCRECGAEFIDQGLRDGHGRARHESKPFVPPRPPERESGESKDTYQNRLDAWAQQAGAMADAQDERRDKVEDEIAPLDLTKTAASRA